MYLRSLAVWMTFPQPGIDLIETIADIFAVARSGYTDHRSFCQKSDSRNRLCSGRC